MSDLQQRAAEIDRLINGRHYKQAVQEAGACLESMLRDLYGRILSVIAPAQQESVTQKVAAIGKNKSIDELTLGQLIGVFREAKLFEHAEKALGRRTSYLASANYNAFVDLRNRAVHKGEAVSPEEAQFFAAQLRLLISELRSDTNSRAESENQSSRRDTHRLRPWTEICRLHPDVESGPLTEAVFAIDLGAIAARDPNVAVVNREPRAFFRATYLTADLRKLLEEVMVSLSGVAGYNRVLKLRTPFGGGKSHTLAALLHAARDYGALAALGDAGRFADPGDVAVAVFDGEKFDARDGKTLDDGRRIQTMWGWLAWQIDPVHAFPLVEGHDRDRVAPGGDVIRDLLTKGASGRPVLVLLDEVLKYMERAAAVAVLDSTLQRQAKDFFQNLTVEISGSKNAAMVYSLQWSARESLGNVALLQELDKLASRVDQLREPVTGDEVLPILQRRLLGAPPDATVADEVSVAYQTVITGMKRAFAESPAERQQAEEDGLLLRDRMRAAYPFHPALIDTMRERWAALDAFQRTRGSLRFLASCLHSLKNHGGAQPLLGPADVPLRDIDVRVKMLKELGAQNDYDAVITADVDGPNARARRIDERLARDTPTLANIRPATRIATAILMYSFGGLRRPGGGESETLPPGVTESDLLAACVGPDLDNITATAVLSELRTSCLYLHYDGIRYCFKKDPNVTKLVEDAEQEIAREETQAKGQGPVRTKIRELLDQRLAGHHSVIVWPSTSMDFPDEDPRFLVGYLPLEFVSDARGEQQRAGIEFFVKYGDKPRRYKNGVALAVPDKKQIEALRRAARYLLAAERVDSKKQQLRLTRDQLDQLRERRRTEEAAVESTLRALYAAVWLPRIEDGNLGLEKIEVGGRPLQATGVHERVMELLTSAGTPKVHGSVTPRKLVERVSLGDSLSPGEPPRLGLRAAQIRDAFFENLEPPRLESGAAIRKAIAKGVADSVFAYTSGTVPTLGADGRFSIAREKVVFGRPIADDEVDLDSGFIMAPSSLPEDASAIGASPRGAVGGSTGSVVPTAPPGPITTLSSAEFTFSATRDQVFKVFPAIANLADRSDGGTVTIRVNGTSLKGYEQSWLRNAVEEPLDEAGVQRK